VNLICQWSYLVAFFQSRNHADKSLGTGFGLKLKKRYYIMFVSRDEDGNLKKVPVPLHYAYIFVAAAAIGMFTITGLAGSYSRMLIKTARFNQLRQDHNALQKDYAHLEEAAHEKDIQAASLGSLANEVSALYGLTASKLAIPVGRLTGKSSRAHAASVAEAVANTPVTETADLTDDSYYKSVDAFYSLRNQAMSGAATRTLSGLNRPGFGMGSSSLLGIGSSFGDLDAASYAPALWPVMGPITSSFGQREDPVLGNGEGEFHKGLDISAPNGVPVRATGDGVVKSAQMENGYGREVTIDHGHGVETLYGHMSGFAVMPGQTVVRGQVIGYVGHSGRVTGAHLHYEVRIRNTPVNPHKYLRMTVAELGSEAPALPATSTGVTKAAGLDK
jgi:murein DD-endopeptidase MepM/ murein hydrolase activator NlpD